MRVPITRLDPSLPAPSYASEGAAGFDFFCRLDTEIAPGEIGSVPANVVIAVPPGYVLVVSLRSSTPRRKHLLAPHGIGVIDQDYRGPEDEIHIQVYNFGRETVTVQRGERIAQGLLLPVARAEWNEGPPTGPSRGGFGSTG